LETIVGFTAIVVVSITLFGTVIDGVYVSILSVAESTAEASVFHMSVFNALYLLAIALATAGWGWLIFDFVRWVIGG
jgi:hypothetical protein